MKFLICLAVVFFSSFCLAADKSKCTYSFDTENSVVEGVGYKFTEKVGVSAQFTGFKINKEEKKPNWKELFDGLVVTVDLMTIDSGNGLRDKNMRETLFSHIVGDSQAVVTVKEITGKVIKTNIKINDKQQDIDFNYTNKGEVITASGKFDALKYALGDQIAALKKRCGSLHTGEDGKSVTHTTFDLKVTAKLKKDCGS